ncbi:DUF4148 domain-containing protein [Trinickia mobilis]|uniref:DUF4148 domain-containing protein n=1 Tax=Trinickia mobilis TaxID=2816356 RepID=UPI001A8EA72B|nr:DUF4148 domain-containing protein [Trinickia mobilis]
MKSITRAVIVAAVISAPVVSFGQSSPQVSRAEVRAELAELEKAGYDPHEWINYPENLQAAEAKVSAQRAMAQAAEVSYGGQSDASSQSGRTPSQSLPAVH